MNNNYNKQAYTYSNDYNHHNKYTKTKEEDRFYKQEKVSKQKVIQQQDNMFSNDTLARLLSVMESVFERYYPDINKYKSAFKFYDSFNASMVKSEEELLTQLMFNAETFKYSYEDYFKKYGKYDFPQNCELKTIKKYIDYWANYVPQDYVDIYIKVKKIFEGNLDFSFKEQIIVIEKNYRAKNNKPEEDPSTILMNSVPQITYFNSKRAEEVENQNGEYVSNLNLNQKYEDSGLSKKLPNFDYSKKQHSFNNHYDDYDGY